MMLFFIQNLHNWFGRKLDVVAYLTAENLALRQQLIVLKRSRALMVPCILLFTAFDIC
jgi:hypothetical protein